MITLPGKLNNEIYFLNLFEIDVRKEYNVIFNIPKSAFKQSQFLIYENNNLDEMTMK